MGFRLFLRDGSPPCWAADVIYLALLGRPGRSRVSGTWRFIAPAMEPDRGRTAVWSKWDCVTVYYSNGFADNIDIIIRGKFPRTISEVPENALKRLENWWNRTTISVNPNRTTVVPFTRLRSKEPIKEPFLFGSRIQLLTQVKYLGLILDKGLTWKQHVQHIVTKLLGSFGLAWLGLVNHGDWSQWWHIGCTSLW